jgi:hypothetical protein
MYFASFTIYVQIAMMLTLQFEEQATGSYQLLMGVSLGEVVDSTNED